MIGEGLSLVDSARGKGSESGEKGRAGNNSRDRVAARTMDQRRNRAGGPLGLVKRKLKKVSASCGLSMKMLQRLELMCLLVIGCAISADNQYADG